MAFTKISQKIKLTFVVFFFMIISLPVVLLVTGIEPRPVLITENRVLSKFPKESLKEKNIYKIIPELNQYFDDNMTFRSHFLNMYIKIVEVLLQSPVRRYITGKDSEFFLHYVSPTVFPFLGVTLFPADYFIRIKLSYAGMAAFCKLKNIKYLVALFPDKPVVYPELLPFWAAKRGVSSYSQFVQVLNSSKVDFIDMTPILLAQKQNFRIYDKHYDVEHWNGNGLMLFMKTFSKLFAKMLGVAELDKDFMYSLKSESGCLPPWPQETTLFMHLENQNFFSLDSQNNGNRQWTEAQFFNNSREGAKGTIWIASDSYLLTTHNKGIVLPLAHYAKRFVRGHYAKFTLDSVTQLCLTCKPDIFLEAFVVRADGSGARASDPKLRILADSYLTTPGYFLTPQFLQTNSVQNLEITTSKDAAIITAHNNEPQIFLPSITTDDDGRAFVAARIDAPIATEVQLDYAEENAAFSEKNAIRTSLKQGENYVHLYFLGKANSIYHLKFYPAKNVGSYTFLPLPEVNALKGGAYGL